VWGVGALGAFPLGIGAALKLNAYVWSPALMLVARGAIAGVAVLPIGIVTVLCATGKPGASRPRLEVGSWLASALLGFTAASAWAFNQFAPELIVVGLAWLTLAVAGLAALASHREVFRSWRPRLLAGGAAAAVMMAPLWRQNFDPARSAKILFNSNAAYA